MDGLGHAVGQSLGFFYAYDWLLGSRYPEWLHGALNVLIGTFWQIGLVTKVTKSKKMAYHLRAMILGMLEEAIGLRSTGKRGTY